MLMWIAIIVLICLLLKNRRNEENHQNNTNVKLEQESVSVEEKEKASENMCVQSTSVELEKDSPNTKLTVKELLPACKPVLIVVSIALIIMIVGILLIELVPNSTGKVLMTVFGAIELAGGIVYYLVADYKDKHICSECGAKREHHREYLGQKSQSRSQKTSLYRANRDSMECLITSYRYEYLHKYVCSKCGNVYKESRWEDGGKVYQYVDRMVVDNRKDIREF